MQETARAAVDRRKAVYGTALRRPPLLPNGRVMNAAGGAPARPLLTGPIVQAEGRRAARIAAALALARAGSYHASLAAP